MAKKNTEKTPRSQVKNALRQMWMRSRERGTAMKRASYSCNRCGIKQSVAKGKEVKVECHHKYMIDWNDLIDLVFERLLQTPDDYEVLCVACHKEEHATTP